jgi:hypothetical protein
MPWGITPSVINEKRVSRSRPFKRTRAGRNLSRRPLYRPRSKKIRSFSARPPTAPMLAWKMRDLWRVPLQRPVGDRQRHRGDGAVVLVFPRAARGLRPALCLPGAGPHFRGCEPGEAVCIRRHLRRLLPADRIELPREVQQNIDMESYRLQQTGSSRIALERRAGILDPQSTKGGYSLPPEEIETLSRIIATLNERFGLNLGPEHRVTIAQMMDRLDGDGEGD